MFNFLLRIFRSWKYSFLLLAVANEAKILIVFSPFGGSWHVFENTFLCLWKSSSLLSINHLISVYGRFKKLASRENLVPLKLHNWSGKSEKSASCLMKANTVSKVLWMITLELIWWCSCCSREIRVLRTIYIRWSPLPVVSQMGFRPQTQTLY